MLLTALDDAWSRAPSAANSLREQLLADKLEAYARIKQGTIASVGKNSANQSYRGYGPGSLTLVQIVEALGSLISFYDQLKQKITDEFLASADWNNAVPGGFDFDTPIYNLLTEKLQIVDQAQLRPDITTINLPGLGRIVAPLSW
jgi:hypothetical protein